MARDDGPRQPAEHHGVVGGYDAGGDRTADPCVRVDVVVDDGSADHVGDDVGDVADRERLRAGRRVLRAGMGVRVDQRLDRDRRDVRGIDERFRAASGRYGDGAFDDRHVFVTEVLHYPCGTQDGVREGSSARELELDGPDVDLWWRLVAAVGAEVRNVPHPGSCGKIEEGGHQAGVLDPHDGGDEVDAVGAFQARACVAGSSQSNSTSASWREAVRAFRPRSMSFCATSDPVRPVPPSTSAVCRESVMTP